MAVLSVEQVTKRYDELVAVDAVSFKARSGRILGLLGPNGAGKTSIIRMITHITAPDAGHILLNGRTVGSWSQQHMGYLPEERGLYKKMTVKDQLVYLAQLKGLSKAKALGRIRHWLDRFSASDWADKRTDGLSKGMQQKVQFIATILHDPSLLIFDEPFSGLDPLNANLLKEVVLELKSENRTILFASHRMEQVEQICDDICLISNGRIVLQGTLREVKRRFGKDTVVLKYRGSDAFLDVLEREGRVHVHRRGGQHAEVRLLNGTPGRRLLEEAMRHTDEIYHYELVEPPLDEIFVSVLQEDAPSVSSSERLPR